MIAQIMHTIGAPHTSTAAIMYHAALANERSSAIDDGQWLQ